MRRIRFVVTGRVQDVAFRAYTSAEAQRLGLVGFVRNRDDGAVEGEAQGDLEAVAAFAQWLQRGSPLARVRHVEVADLQTGVDEDRFTVLR